MAVFSFLHPRQDVQQKQKDGVPEAMVHHTQLHDKSEGSEFLDDAIRVHDQPLADDAGDGQQAAE